MCFAVFRCLCVTVISSFGVLRSPRKDNLRAKDAIGNIDDALRVRKRGTEVFEIPVASANWDGLTASWTHVGEARILAAFSREPSVNATLN